LTVWGDKLSKKTIDAQATELPEKVLGSDKRIEGWRAWKGKENARETQLLFYPHTKDTPKGGSDGKPL